MPFRGGLDLDDTQISFYGLKFENAFLREKGKAFETFFARVMGHGFPGDFEPVRPYGPRGDLKCDGYRGSDGTVFQSYAPDAMKLDQLLDKIEEDFHGALSRWGSRMRRWAFVHNDMRGLPAEANRKMADLRAANPAVAIDVIGYPELREIAMRLAVHQLQDLFGDVPSQRTMEKLDFAPLASCVRVDGARSWWRNFSRHGLIRASARRSQRLSGSTMPSSRRLHLAQTRSSASSSLSPVA